MIDTAIITDGGMASRFMPYSKTIPKGMLPLGNKPVMHLILEECEEAGVRKVYIVTNAQAKGLYEDYFLKEISSAKRDLLRESAQKELDEIDKLRERLQIEIVVQPDSLPYGNGTPLLAVKDKLQTEDSFLYLYGDNITFGKETSAEALVNEYKKDDTVAACIAVKRVIREQIQNHASIVIRDEKKQTIESLVEKPKPEEAPSLLASYGRYVLTNTIFDYLKEGALGKNNELWTVDAISKLAGNARVKYVIPDNKCMTTGDPENYHKAILAYYDSSKAREL